MRCASVLAFMMHNVEVPVIMRQTIKCASLFFKLVDFTKLKLHNLAIPNFSETLIEESNLTANEFLMKTLRQVGAKISNTLDE